jgi:hypothetical protein
MKYQTLIHTHIYDCNIMFPSQIVYGYITKWVTRERVVHYAIK